MAIGTRRFEIEILHVMLPQSLYQHHLSTRQFAIVFDAHQDMCRSTVVGDEQFVRDFVAAWIKVITANRVDL